MSTLNRLQMSCELRADKKAKEEEGWLDSIDFWSDDEAGAEKMAEEETGSKDGYIRSKGRRGKKDKAERPKY